MIAKGMEHILISQPIIGEHIANFLMELHAQHRFPMNGVEVVTDNIAMGIAHYSKLALVIPRNDVHSDFPIFLLNSWRSSVEKFEIN